VSAVRALVFWGTREDGGMTVKVDGLPQSIRVGPFDMTFVELTGEDAEANNGEFTASDGTIGLRPEFLDGARAADTLIHEILHAIWFVADLKTEQGEEFIVNTQAIYLTQVFRDHPELLAWLTSMVGPQK
jgi:hypothetical protein